ncbi:T-cell-specific surface glycoprotein CD28 [Hoplias malabaricus]|uniref:T-cell-specific surface glycoprotein CD28 n=1 Tax=Hoplias malabaricus TaxID=27720 RepID=UPI0034625DBE
MIVKASWLCATLLPLFLFVRALPEKQCRDSFPTIQRVMVHGNISVSCPYFEGREMVFQLQKDSEILCSVKRNVTSGRQLKLENMSITHHLNLENNSTSFILYNVTLNHTGLYICEGEKRLPPPVLTAKEVQTIVIVEENLMKGVQLCEPPVNNLSLWVGLGVLTLYGLIITYTAVSFRSRLTRLDLTKHDYVNMKHRGRRKNQGILLPTRLSWYSDNTTAIAPCKFSSKRVDS